MISPTRVNEETSPRGDKGQRFMKGVVSAVGYKKKRERETVPWL